MLFNIAHSHFWRELDKKGPVLHRLKRGVQPFNQTLSDFEVLH